MRRKKIILITGANGEVGHGLIENLTSTPGHPEIVVLDIRLLDHFVIGEGVPVSMAARGLI